MHKAKRDLATVGWLWAGTVSGGVAMACVLMLVRG